VTFNERLTAMGGLITRKVEVYEGGSWNHRTIRPIGNKDGNISGFTSLAINNQLYVFGNILVYYCNSLESRLRFFLKLNYFLLLVRNNLKLELNNLKGGVSFISRKAERVWKLNGNLNEKINGYGKWKEDTPLRRSTIYTAHCSQRSYVINEQIFHVSVNGKNRYSNMY